MFHPDLNLDDAMHRPALTKRQAPGGGRAATQTMLVSTNPNDAQVTGTPTNSGHTVAVTAYTTDPSDASAATSSGAAAALTGSASQTAGASTTGNNTNWTDGQRAGLAIGIIAAACLSLIILGYIMRHKRRRKEALSNGQNYNVGGAWKKQRLQYKEADFEPLTQATNDNPFDWRNHRRMSSFGSAASTTGSGTYMKGPNRATLTQSSPTTKASVREDIGIPASIDERLHSADYDHRPSARFSTDQIRANILESSGAAPHAKSKHADSSSKAANATEMRQLLRPFSSNESSAQPNAQRQRRNSLDYRNVSSYDDVNRPKTTGANKVDRASDTPASRTVKQPR